MQFRPRNHHLSHDSPMLNHATEPPVLPELPVRSHRFRRIRLKNHQMENKLSDLHLGNALFLNEMLTNSFFAPFNHNYTVTS